MKGLHIREFHSADLESCSVFTVGRHSRKSYGVSPHWVHVDPALKHDDQNSNLYEEQFSKYKIQSFGSLRHALIAAIKWNQISAARRFVQIG